MPQPLGRRDACAAKRRPRPLPLPAQRAEGDGERLRLSGATDRCHAPPAL